MNYMSITHFIPATILNSDNTNMEETRTRNSRQHKNNISELTMMRLRFITTRTGQESEIRLILQIMTIRVRLPCREQDRQVEADGAINRVRVTRAVTAICVMGASTSGIFAIKTRVGFEEREGGAVEEV